MADLKWFAEHPDSLNSLSREDKERLLDEIETVVRARTYYHGEKESHPYMRLLTGWASTPEGEVNIANKWLPKDRMASMVEGEPGIIGPKGTSPLNKPGIDVSDFTNMFGYAPQTALSTVGGIGGAAVGAPTGPGALISGMGGAALGESIGDALRQGVANLLGANEKFDPRSVAIQGMGAAAGEVVGGLGARVVNRVRNPFKGLANTPRIEAIRNAANELDPTGELLRKIPPAGLTEDPRAAAMQNFVREAPTTAHRAEIEIFQPYKNAIDEIGQGVRDKLSPVGLRSELTSVLEGARATTKARDSQLIEDAFAELEKVMPGGFSVEVQSAISEIGKSMKFRAVDELGKDITTKRLADLAKVAAKVKSFRGLRAFKTRLGEMVAKDELGSAGPAIQRALYEDFERIFGEVLPSSVGGLNVPVSIQQSGTEAVTQAWDTARKRASTEFLTEESPTVRGLFDLRAGESLAQTPNRLFRRNNEAGVSKFLQAIGASGDTKLGFEIMPQGIEARNAVTRAWLDDVFEKATDQTGDLDPTVLWNRIFGKSGPGDEILDMMFDPDTLSRLKLWTFVARESDVGHRSFLPVTQAAVRAELIAAFYNPLKYALVIAPLEGVLSKTFGSEMGRTAISTGLGKERGVNYLLRGLTQTGRQAAMQGAKR